ncbi:Mediator of RNA polymerase II transcription subunit 13 [Rhynchospora pubera]|uniref:Mediator of RNA polymerase II transcription subunit 13 n=1 Tax=Rhynchospora pubera TaxID=906938 RepID=A0AAV8CLL6_9POAL|nr:Mediator of RNA polymerase II transcription subunit 13 [Rhynchospora pubera]
MWTNVFRIGELQTISWFQFLPLEPDPNTLPEKSSKAEQKDAANYAVLSAHLQLQNEGYLTTWTNSFVGPWDPSQGVHNPDEKIKLWLFIPGRQSSVVETVQSAVSKLRVAGTGLWLAPGDSEEVALALSQALRNTLERAMRSLSYVRFGDVFTRTSPLRQSERSLRRAQPTVEFIFSATEEAIYVHVIVSAKYIRTLCGDDIEKILIHSSHSANDGLPVIVAPNGMLGRLTGCCPSELVKQVYISKLKSPNGWTTGAPYVTQSPGCQMRGQSFYVEVALGCSSSPCKESKTELIDQAPVVERTFIYPPEAVLVPMMHRAFSRFSSKRFWLQNGTDTSLAESWPFWNFSGASFVEHCLALGSTCHVESSRNSSCLRLRRRRRNTSSSSLTSSISSASSSSSESGPATAGDGGDFDGDADSLATKQTGSNHGNTQEINSQAGKGTDIVQANRITDPSDINRGNLWAGLDDEGTGLDINILLSEFGEFGGFFENDLMSFGEPPGMEVQVPFSDTNGGEMISTSPSIQPIEMPDQLLSPVISTSFEGTTHLQPVSLIDEARPKFLPESIKETSQIISPIASNQSMVPFSKQHDHLTKAEAFLAFAPEYAAIEFSTASENLASPFSNGYQPTSRKADSSGSSTTNSYVYNATPPPPHPDSSEDKGEASSKLYTLVLSGKKESGQISNKSTNNTEVNSSKSDLPPPVQSGAISLSTSTSLTKKNVNTIESGHFLLPTKMALATDMDCIMYQAAMCRIRHTLISLKSKTPAMASSMFEIKKKENINIPVRIGDMESDLSPHDGSLTSQVGVWRSVGGPKPLKPCGSSLSDESLAVNAHHRQHLLDFLAALGLLVQQSASFVDGALDTSNGEGPYAWLALQEQCRRSFPCEPDAAHAGCGGLLAMCHSVDLAGVDLVDPLAADVTVPSVISLLQSDIKQALKSAFGNSDGPLPLIDWCKGRAHLGDSGSTGDTYSFLYGSNEARDSSSSVTAGGDSTSPPQSTGTSLTHREGTRTDGLSQRRSSQDTSNSEQEQEKGSSRVKPTLSALPTPSLLVGYQDDWLKASVNCIQLWEKAPLEPYASPKPVTYYAICPDIELLTTASIDFFQQLGTVYEICKLGTHSSQMSGGQMELSGHKASSSGLFLVEVPQQMKNCRSHFTSVSSISDFFMSLSKGWSVKSFINSLTKVIRDLKFTPNSSLNQKESNGSPCTVVYVVCPFPDPSAVLETLVECSVALGTAVLTPSERERKSMLYSHVLRALNPNTGIDESSSNSNVIMLSGFNLPKVVLQIITVESILRLNNPSFNELSLLKDIAFTVYNKARRVPRSVVSGPTHDPVHSASSFPGRPQMMHHMSQSPMPNLWKDCLVPRMPGSAALNSREPDFDPSMRPVSWGDNSWQSMQRSVADQYSLDDKKYLFEPLFILGEPGSVDHATAVFESNSASKSGIDEGGSDSVMSHPDGLSDHSKAGSASLHCCYGWTEDWRWFVCIWTDSRGELLDSLVFPFGGVSGRQDTKVLQGLFVQVLQQGCQIIAGAASSDNVGPARPRYVIITRLGGFFELECQEWQKAIYSIGGNEVKKWPIQLRRSSPDSSQDTAFIQERNLPSSPSPSSMYGSAMSSKSGFMKGGSTKKQLMGATQAATVDTSRGSSALHLVQSITLVGVSLDHSLHLILQSELSQYQSGGPASYLEGFSPVKSLSSVSASASYLLIPSPSLRYLSTTPLQLPTCLTSDSPPLAHLLHSKGMAIPLSTGYVVSKSVHPVRKDLSESVREDWPSVLSVTLVDHYGGGRRGKQGRGFLGGDVASRDNDVEAHAVLETVAAELHSLSWLTVSPVFGDRRSALPFHCDMILRLRRLLHYADRLLSRPVVKAEQV